MNTIADINTKIDDIAAYDTKRDLKTSLTDTLQDLGETLGEFKSYDSQLPIVEIPGTRIVKCLYQESKATGKKVADNSYTRIPISHITEQVVVDHIAELAPYVVDMLQLCENSMIKEEHKKGLLRVYTEHLSLGKIIDKLEESTTSGRLTKEIISSWYASSVAPILLELFIEKTEGDKEKAAMFCEGYKNKFISLANPKIFIKEEDCLAMMNVLEKCDLIGGDNEDIMAKKFIAKFDKMSDKTEDVLAAL